MKTFFKKSRLTVLTMTSLLSGMYAQSSFSSQPTVTVNVDGSFTIPNEDNVTTESINKKIKEVEYDENLTKYTIAKDGEENEEHKISPDENGYYIPKEDGKYVTKNTLVIIGKSDDSFKNNLIGGKFNAYDTDIENTNILITSGNNKGDIIGALSNGGDAKGNVYISGGNIANDQATIYGAQSYTGKAQGNVYISGGDVSINVNGANSSYGDIEGNVFISGGNIDGQVSGAISDGGKVKGNVFITGGTINNVVFGAVNRTGTETVGNVFITGGTINNIVSAVYASEIEGNIYLFGKVDFQRQKSGLYGLYNGGIRTSSLQTRLFMASNPLTVSTAGNFKQYNFYLNKYNSKVINNKSTALLTVIDSFSNIKLMDIDEDGFIIWHETKSVIKLAGISKDIMVNDGSQIILISAKGAQVTSGADNIAFSDIFETKDGDTSEVEVGLTGKADVTYGIDNDEQKVTATISDYHVDEDRTNENLKPLAEGRLATLQNVVRGAEVLQNIMGENKPIGTFTPIAEISGGINQYGGSSSIESKDYRLIVGSRYQILDNLYAGVALNYGRSNYDSNNGDKTGEGNTDNYGVSLFSKYTHSLTLGDFYLDGALRFGRASTKMYSSDIVTGGNDFASYRSKVNYVGVNAGLGFIYDLNETSSFDSSIRYLWTRLGSDNVMIDGDDIHFKKANSSKAQLKEQYSYKKNENLTFTLAGIYEYEFDSKAGASVLDVSIDAPSMKGSTGIVELGVKGTPIADSKDFTFNLKFQGYSGKRSGASASAFFEYDF